MGNVNTKRSSVAVTYTQVEGRPLKQWGPENRTQVPSQYLVPINCISSLLFRRCAGTGFRLPNPLTLYEQQEEKNRTKFDQMMMMAKFKVNNYANRAIFVWPGCSTAFHFIIVIENSLCRFKAKSFDLMGIKRIFG